MCFLHWFAAADGRYEMKKAKKDCAKTMLLSVILSAPCPIIVGLGLFFGHSSTQIADFFRLSTELIGIILAYVVYVLTNKEGACDEERKARLESFSNIFVGAIMCIGGIIMLIVCLTSTDTDKGNVIPGLAVSAVGAVANIFFWRKYVCLNRRLHNDIVAVQVRMYGAKSIVDICVVLALLSVSLFPNTLFSFYFDLIGSVVVALYVVFCGSKTLFEKLVLERVHTKKHGIYKTAI